MGPRAHTNRCIERSAHNGCMAIFLNCRRDTTSDAVNIDLEYPAVYNSAGKLSANSQRDYLWTLRAEYAVLIVCAAMSSNQVDISEYYYFYSFLFSLGLGLFVWRYVTKPEQAWYQGRALAESVKTSVWRFCMRAAPFDDTNLDAAVANFRNHLTSILAANQYAGTRLPASFAADHQVTVSMRDVRRLNRRERMDFYEKKRIVEQRAWYAAKAGANKTIGRRWVLLCIAVYASAIIASLIRAAHPTWQSVPTEILIAIAASILGWIQIKKFNELAASYILTAHEIGIIHTGLQAVSSETDFSNFVNESEQAFSREHTQWVARTEQ